MTGHTWGHGKHTWRHVMPGGEVRMTYQQALKFLRRSIREAFGCGEEDAKRFAWHSNCAGSFNALLERGFPGKVRRGHVGWCKAKSERHYARVDWGLQVEFMKALYSDWESE